MVENLSLEFSIECVVVIHIQFEIPLEGTSEWKSSLIFFFVNYKASLSNLLASWKTEIN